MRYALRGSCSEYYLQLQARPSNHLTTLALLHIMSSTTRNGMRTKWLAPLHAVLNGWDVCFSNGLPSPVFSDLYAKNKSILSCIIKTCADSDWEAEVKDLADLKIHADVSNPVSDNRLPGVQRDMTMLSTFGYAHNLIHSPPCCTNVLLLCEPCRVVR